MNPPITPGPFSSDYASYFDRGYSIIPIKPGAKNPLPSEWNRWCSQQQTIELLDKWSQTWPDAGIGLCCGSASRTIAVDIDLDLKDPSQLEIFEKIRPHLPLTAVSKRGKKGFTSLYLFDGESSKSFSVWSPGRKFKKMAIEILSTGRQTILPPTIHPETRLQYAWTDERLMDIDPTELPLLPRSSIQAIEEVCAESILVLPAGVANHSGRNESLKAQTIAAILKGKKDNEISIEILRYDQANHQPPLFSDSKEPQMKGRSKEDNAIRFVESIRKSLRKPHSSNSDSDTSLVKSKSIIINGRQLRDTIRDTQEAILTQNSPPIFFQRFGQMVKLTQRSKHLEIQDFGIHEMFVYLTRIADWFRIDEEGTKTHAKPDKDVVRALLACPDERLPKLSNVITAPTVGQDGQLVVTAGYCAPDELFFDGSQNLSEIEIPHCPSPLDIETAVSLIKDELLGDFPFAEEVDRCHVFAALVLPVVRRLIKGPTPLHLVDAPTPGSGKTLIADLISIITIGEAIPCQTLPEDDDEMRKRITAELTRGLPLIVIDNAPNAESKPGIRGFITSPTLAAAITSEHWTDRKLGVSQMVSFKNNALWIMTGNNIKLSMELARRTIRIRLVPNTDRPWARDPKKFKHPNIRRWARENRPVLVKAILTIIQGWIFNGRPIGDKCLGSFEEWSEVIGGILKTAGLVHFLSNSDSFFEDADAEGAEWRGFISAWAAEFQSSEQKVSALNSLCAKHDLMNGVRGSSSEKSQETRLGKALRCATDRIYETWQIKLSKDRKNHGKFYKLVPLKETAKNGIDDSSSDYQPPCPQHKNDVITDLYLTDENIENIFLQSEDPHNIVDPAFSRCSTSQNDPQAPYVPSGNLESENG